jgi:hypothetical protein
MPTPRPETSVIFSAVENPGRKIRAKASASLRLSSGLMSPRSTALALIRAQSRPLPSSTISMTTLPAEC